LHLTDVSFHPETSILETHFSFIRFHLYSRENIFYYRTLSESPYSRNERGIELSVAILYPIFSPPFSLKREMSSYILYTASFHFDTPFYLLHSHSRYHYYLPFFDRCTLATSSPTHRLFVPPSFLSSILVQERKDTLYTPYRILQK